MEIEIETENYFTELREIDGTQTVAILNDQSTLHVVTRKDPFGREAEPNTRVPVDIILRMPSNLQMITRNNPSDGKAEVELEAALNVIFAFTFNNCYSSNIFQGIMPDSGAAGVLTAGNP